MDRKLYFEGTVNGQNFRFTEVVRPSVVEPFGTGAETMMDQIRGLLGRDNSQIPLMASALRFAVEIRKFNGKESNSIDITGPEFTARLSLEETTAQAE